MTDFKGWVSRGYLPHFDTPEVIQAVTFRLAGSLPPEVMERFSHEADASAKVDAFLDSGHDRCLLRRPDIADLVEPALLHFDGERYRLLAWVVMPNHVHVLVQPGVPLADLLHSWKSFTGKAINRLIGERGQIWQPDYFDRYIRDDSHLCAARAYVEGNPVKAGLCSKAKDWRWSSAYWRDG
jgi:putative transposase